MLLKSKTISKQGQPQNEDNFQNKDDINEDNIIKEDDLQNQAHLRDKDKLKNALSFEMILENAFKMCKICSNWLGLGCSRMLKSKLDRLSPSVIFYSFQMI